MEAMFRKYNMACIHVVTVVESCPCIISWHVAKQAFTQVCNPKASVIPIKVSLHNSKQDSSELLTQTASDILSGADWDFAIGKYFWDCALFCHLFCLLTFIIIKSMLVFQ